MKFITYNEDTLSKLSLGTVQFGLDYGIANNEGQPNLNEVQSIVDFVCSKGINCFDTAQAYGNSEEILGTVIKNKTDLYIISKIKSNLFKENAIYHIETSLQNIKRSSLYALLLHDSELLNKWSISDSKTVLQLKEKNKIKYFGVSIYTDDDFNNAIINDSIDFIQVPFNIFDQRALTNEWFKKAKNHNKLIFIRSIFLQGLLFMDKEKLPNNLKKAKEHLSALDNFCKELQITRAELALSFVDSVAQDSLLLFGCENLIQAKENISSYNSLKVLNRNVVQQIRLTFKNVDESIYNPTKW